MTVKKGRWFKVEYTAGGTWLVSGTVAYWCKALGNGSWVVWPGRKYNVPKTLTSEQVAHDYASIKIDGALWLANEQEQGRLDNEFSLVWE